MRDWAGVAVRFVRGTPPAKVSAAARVHPARGSARYGGVTHGRRTSTFPLSHTAVCGNRREVVEVEAIPTELLLDQGAFVVGVDVRRREKRSVQSKKRFDSLFNVQAYSVGVSAAHQALAAHLADPPRTRATGEISVHALLLSV
jgi:hypothetical protein